MNRSGKERGRNGCIKKVNSETGNFRRAPFVSLEEKVVVDDTYDNCSCFIWATSDSNPGFRNCSFYIYAFLTYRITYQLVLS